MSRFGYLRTPRPADASPAAQADAHVCLLDALGIGQAAVVGGSAGAPSAMQTAIRDPARVSALLLPVPLAYKPATVADSAPPLAAPAEAMLMRLIGSDLLFWTGLHLARDQVIRYVLATLPEQVAAASPQECARVNAILDAILPVSARAAGLRGDRHALRSLLAVAAIAGGTSGRCGSASLPTTSTHETRSLTRKQERGPCGCRCCSVFLELSQTNFLLFTNLLPPDRRAWF